jgi:enamidase
MSRLLAVLLPAFLAVSCADSSEEPALVVGNARVFVGDGTVLESASVAMAGDRIVSVAVGTVEAPGASRIDAEGRTVLPGLIDTHVHLLMEKLYEQPRSDADMTSYIAERLPERLRAYLRAGITTVMSPGDYWPFVAAIRDRVREGGLAGPRIHTAGPLFTGPGGHPAATFCGFLDQGGQNPWCKEHLTVEVATPEEARAAVARIKREGVDRIKFVNEALDGTGAGALQPDVVGAIVDAAHGHDLRAYAHITDPAKAVTAIEAGLDGLVHIPVASTEPEAVERLVEIMGAKGLRAASTLTIFHSMANSEAPPGNEDVPEMMQQMLAGMRQTLSRIVKADPDLVVFGTDSPHLAPAEAFHTEVGLLGESGLTPTEILQSATGRAAQFIGVGDKLGTLEPGKLADLVVVDGDPTTDLSTLKNVVVVVKSGEIVYERP